MASGADEGVRKARLHKPDIVLLDVAMPGHSGLDAVRAIKEAAPKAAILVLSMHDDQSIVREAFAAGVSGYLLKEAIDSELVTAIREVAAGRRYLHPPLGARLAQAEHRAAARAAADPLSDREREVARLLALGHTNQEIAKMLFISVRTAETHRAHIMQKLKLSTRSALVPLRDPAGPARRRDARLGSNSSHRARRPRPRRAARAGRARRSPRARARACRSGGADAPR